MSHRLVGALLPVRQLIDLPVDRESRLRDASLQPIAQAREQRVDVAARQVHRVDRQLEMIERFAQRRRDFLRRRGAAFELAHRGREIRTDAVVHVAQDALALRRHCTRTLELRDALERCAQLAFLLLDSLRERRLQLQRLGAGEAEALAHDPHDREPEQHADVLRPGQLAESARNDLRCDRIVNACHQQRHETDPQQHALRRVVLPQIEHQPHPDARAQQRQQQTQQSRR